jgi:hypothetical protein
MRPLAILALVCLSTPALAQADYGGRIVDYYGQPSGPILEDCYSACTLRLGAPNHPCIGRDVVFHFHHAHNHDGTPNQIGTRIMGGAIFNPGLRRMFWANPQGFELTGSQLARFGYRICR